MKKISKISVQKNNPERYNIYMTNGEREEYAFSVTENILIKYGLKKGKELTPFEIEEILYHEDIEKAVTASYQYLSFRMRSEFEVFTYLKEKGFTIPTIQEAIHKLKSLGYVDDLQFAKSYVETQINAQDKGPKVIYQWLKSKRVQENLIYEALQLFDYEKQVEVAKKLAEKKGIKKGVSQKQLINNLKQMLLRKGFDIPIIEEAMNKIDFTEFDELEESAIKIQGEKAWKKYSALPPFERTMKVKQFLYRKGFDIDLIEAFIANKE